MILLELNANVTSAGRSKFNSKAKRLLVWWHNSLIKVEIYVFVKYWNDWLIYGWDTTTSGFWKHKGSQNLKIGHVTPTPFDLICIFSVRAPSHQYVHRMASWLALMWLIQDIAILRSRQFSLKLPIHAHFGWGHISPNGVTILTQKGTSLSGNTSFEPLSVCAGSTVWHVERIEKKIRTVDKVTKVLYFTYLGRTPRRTDLSQSVHVGSCPGRNHVCQISEWNLRGCDSTGIEISFFLLIFEWPLQQCSATALHVLQWLLLIPHVLFLLRCVFSVPVLT